MGIIMEIINNRIITTFTIIKKIVLKRFVATIWIYKILAISVLTGCTISNNGIDPNKTPDWINNHPVSRNYYIGVGSAKVDKNLYTAQKNARNMAIGDISQQLHIVLSTNTSMNNSWNYTNGNVHNNSIFTENIKTFSKVYLENWEEVQTYNSPGGYVWSKVVLEKKKYHTMVNSKLHDAEKTVRDILRKTRNGSAHYRITELYRGLGICDTFGNLTIKTGVRGKDVLLYNELIRRFAQLFENIEIRSMNNTSNNLQKAKTLQTISVQVFLGNESDKSLSLRWSFSSDISIQKVHTVKSNGEYSVTISVPIAKEPIVCTVMPDLNSMTYDLIRRRIKLPIASFSLNEHRIKRNN